MVCLGCGGRWFTEIRQVLPSAPPSGDGATVIPTRVHYAYACVECGLNYGDSPKPRRKKGR